MYIWVIYASFHSPGNVVNVFVNECCDGHCDGRRSCFQQSSTEFVGSYGFVRTEGHECFVHRVFFYFWYRECCIQLDTDKMFELCVVIVVVVAAAAAAAAVVAVAVAVVIVAVQIIPVLFGSTRSCVSGFLVMNLIKNATQGRLTNK